jgi:hypothetical protein
MFLIAAKFVAQLSTNDQSCFVPKTENETKGMAI